jgi:hypothetical protein
VMCHHPSLRGRPRARRNGRQTANIRNQRA